MPANSTIHSIRYLSLNIPVLSKIQPPVMPMHIGILRTGNQHTSTPIQVVYRHGRSIWWDADMHRHDGFKADFDSYKVPASSAGITLISFVYAKMDFI